MRALPLLALTGCFPPDAPEVRPPATWRLVEVDRPGGLQLVLERDRPACPAGPHRVDVRLSRKRAAVGDVVEAEVRLPAGCGPHRLIVRPGRAGVRILGPVEFRIEGAESVRVRFTCDSAGRGGIDVVVEAAVCPVDRKNEMR